MTTKLRLNILHCTQHGTNYVMYKSLITLFTFTGVSSQVVCGSYKGMFYVVDVNFLTFFPYPIFRKHSNIIVVCFLSTLAQFLETLRPTSSSANSTTPLALSFSAIVAVAMPPGRRTLGTESTAAVAVSNVTSVRFTRKVSANSGSAS